MTYCVAAVAVERTTEQRHTSHSRRTLNQPTNQPSTPAHNHSFTRPQHPTGVWCDTRPAAPRPEVPAGGSDAGPAAGWREHAAVGHGTPRVNAPDHVHVVAPGSWGRGRLRARSPVWHMHEWWRGCGNTTGHEPSCLSGLLSVRFAGWAGVMSAVADGHGVAAPVFRLSHHHPPAHTSNTQSLFHREKSTCRVSCCSGLSKPLSFADPLALAPRQ